MSDRPRGQQTSELIQALKGGRVIDYSLMMAMFGDHLLLRIYRKHQKGISLLYECKSDNGSISEPELQDLMTAFTRAVVEEMITTHGVRVVPPL